MVEQQCSRQYIPNVGYLDLFYQLEPVVNYNRFKLIKHDADDDKRHIKDRRLRKPCYHFLDMLRARLVRGTCGGRGRCGRRGSTRDARGDGERGGRRPMDIGSRVPVPVLADVHDACTTRGARGNGERGGRRLVGIGRRPRWGGWGRAVWTQRPPGRGVVSPISGGCGGGGGEGEGDVMIVIMMGGCLKT